MPTVTHDPVPAVSASLAEIRRTAPLVHNITNYVVMNNTANALLALGASPAMVHATDEVEEFVGISRALVVNIGTLSAPWVAAMRAAAERAKRLGVPWALDPVGAGATTFRTAVAADLAARGPAVIRGNASEIMALAGTGARTKGVDSAHGTGAAVDAAREIAHRTGATVAVTGATDYVTDGQRLATLNNGHPLMAKVTGMGCTATAIIGAFLAVERDPFRAAIDGLTVLGVAGEIAAERSPGPGSLQLQLLDALHVLDDATIAERARIELA
ncbi:MAG: hydroxyethylthiazole kinase [Gemmatimonadaceae bacterium]